MFTGKLIKVVVAMDDDQELDAEGAGGVRLVPAVILIARQSGTSPLPAP